MTTLQALPKQPEAFTSEPEPASGSVAHSLRRNTSWTFIGNATYAACQWGMLVSLTKLGDPAMVGQFALGLAITAPLFMFSNLHLRSVLVTDAVSEFEFSDYLGLRLLTTTAALLVVPIIGILGGYQTQALLAIVAIGIVKAIESVNDICYGFMQRRERMDRIARGQIINGLLAMVGLAVCLWITGDLLMGIAAWSLATLATLLCWNVPTVARLGASASHWNAFALASSVRTVMWPRWHRESLRRLSWTALPLGVVMMLISLNINVPRFVLERHMGEAELGIFASLAYLLIASGMVSVAIGQAAAPRLANFYAAANRSAYVGLVAKMVAVGFAFGAIGVFVSVAAGRPLLTLLYTSEYAQHIDVLVWLAVSAGIGFMASALGYAITAARFFRVQVPLNSAVMAATIIAAFLLIPEYGLIGAAWTAALTSIVQLLGSGIILWTAVRRLTRDHA